MIKIGYYMLLGGFLSGMFLAAALTMASYHDYVGAAVFTLLFFFVSVGSVTLLPCEIEKLGK